MSWYVLEDKQAADKAIQEEKQHISAIDNDDRSAHVLEDDGHFHVADDRQAIMSNSVNDEQPTFMSAERTESHLI